MSELEGELAVLDGVGEWESNDYNDARIVLNCLLYGSLYRLWDHCTQTHGIYGLVLATCTVESTDGWNALTAVQQWLQAECYST